MKNLFLVLLFSFNCYFASAQTNALNFKQQQLQSKYFSKIELKDGLIKYDFSALITHTDNAQIFGFIGDNYQRIRIKLISVTKVDSLPDTYKVYGKSMVKGNIDKFNGTIKILNIRKLKTMSYGVDDKYKNKRIKGEYSIIADYKFSETINQPHSGIFKGVCKSDFYLDKDSKVHYDDIDLNADGYTNNQFVGEWASYDGNIIKNCNWGDFRIPNSGDLDVGAGEFSPSDKYLKYGWQSVRNLVVNNKDSEKAKQIENAKWWK